MFAYLRMRWELWRIQRVRKKTAATYNSKVDEAKKKGASADEISDIWEMAGKEDYFYDEDVYRAHTDYLMTEAHRLIIPTPDYWDNKDRWEDRQIGTRYLTKKAINELRSAIRAEKKARAERFLIWIPGVVGILGTLIGLVSILVNRHG